MTLIEMMNPFTGKKTEEAPDYQPQVQLEADPLVKEVAKVFEHLSKTARQRPRHGYEVRKYFDDTVQTIELPALAPSQINTLLHVITPFKPADQKLKAPWRPAFAGMFVSKTLVDAYKNGVRQVTLTIPEGLKIACLAQRIEVDAKTDDDRLRLDIHGDVNSHFATWSKDCDFYIHGDVTGVDYGNHATDCLFDLHGDIYTEWLASGYGNMRIYRGKLRSHTNWPLEPKLFSCTDTVAVADPKLYEQLIMFKHQQYRMRERCDVRIELLKP